MRSATRFLQNERGATAVEYGLLVALIAAAIIGALSLFSGNLTLTMNNMGTELVEASAPEE